MSGGVVVGGINRTQQAMRGAGEIYKSFGKNSTQIAAFHGIPDSAAKTLTALVAEGKEAEVVRVLTAHPEWLYLWELLYGGVRSGKTFAIAYRVWMTAARIPGAQILVVRKRKEQLRHTFLSEFEKVGNLLTDGKLEYMGEMQPERDGSMDFLVWTADPKHPSRVIFAIEPDQATDKDIQERWKGYTLIAGVTEETPQLREITVYTTQMRVSQETDGNGNSVGAYRWMATICNPVHPTHWLAKVKRESLAEMAMGHRPSILTILSRPADNAHNLPQGYEEEQRAILKDKPHLISSWFEGEDEVEVQGKPVYGAQFNPTMHVSNTLKFASHLPLLRGWDFGYHRPACVFAQEDLNGNINMLGELMGENETAEQFAERVLQYTAQNFYEPTSVKDFGDPAGAQQTDKGDTTIAILMRKGIRMNFRPTKIDPGIKIVRACLTRNRSSNGMARPEVMFSEACPILIEAVKRGYCYFQFKDGTFSVNPHKDGYFEHLADAWRYLMVGIRMGLYDSTVESDLPSATGAKPMVAKGMDALEM